MPLLVALKYTRPPRRGVLFSIQFEMLAARHLIGLCHVHMQLLLVAVCALSVLAFGKRQLTTPLLVALL